MRRLLVFALLGCTPANAGSERQVLEKVLIFDGTGREPFLGNIELAGETIGSVTAITNESATPETRFVMPGLIDAHTHMMRGGSCGRDEGLGWDNVAQIPLNFDVALAHGNTTVVDLGAPLHGAVALREWMRTNGYDEPRYITAGALITAPQGYPLDWAPRDVVEGMVVALEAGDPASGRAAVRRLHAAGVDLIKVAIMELSYNEHPLPALDVATLQAIVDEAHRHNLRVFAHAHSNEGYRRALAGGVDVIAHSTFEALTDNLIAEAKRRNVIVIPTLWVFDAFDKAETDAALLGELQPQLRPDFYRALVDFHKRAHGREDLPDDFLPGLRRSRLRWAMTNARNNLRRLRDAGLRIAFGTDTSFCYALHGSAVHELQEWIEAGLTPREALQGATGGSAAALGRSDLGVIRQGARADLVVVAGNPFADVGDLAKVDRVILGGRVVHAAGQDVYAQTGIGRTLATGAVLLRGLFGARH